MFRRLRELFRSSVEVRDARHENGFVCVGRQGVVADVIRSAYDQGCVLLFGGRQSGKTTVLRQIALDLDSETRTSTLGQARLPVFVDLMRLRYDATSADVFRALGELAISSCLEQFPNVRPASPLRSCISLEGLESLILDVRAQVPTRDLRFTFLLDETKRIIGKRFPRGFHDNLFHMLFGASPIAGVCNIVFAGAQDLYSLCEDDTSPIGSRAAKHCLISLALPAVIEMASMSGVVYEACEAGAAVFEMTGGHAGVSAGILRALRDESRPLPEAVSLASRQFSRERSELFQLWVGALTSEARVVHDMLMQNGRVRMDEILEGIQRAGLPLYRLDRALEELQFTGIAHLEGSSLVACNRIYNEHARMYLRRSVGSETERPVWTLIEETERGLRNLVQVAFEREWPLNSERMFQKALGDDTWRRVLANQSAHSNSYPKSEGAIDAAYVLDFAYLGQLGQLMTWNGSWSLFSHLFRDKRELNDLVAAITPVRNDIAHFRSVPDQERERCRLACRDLLTIVERSQRPTPV